MDLGEDFKFPRLYQLVIAKMSTKSFLNVASQKKKIEKQTFHWAPNICIAILLTKLNRFPDNEFGV